MSHTARNFVLQLGSLATLYAVLSAAIVVVFGVINMAFPDAADAYWQYQNAQSGIRFGIAVLVVFFPAFIVLTRLSNKAEREEGEKLTTLTRWLVYLSLFVGGGILLGDLVAVIMTYLNGEITTRFILKALTLFIFISGAFKYYVLLVRGYWMKHEKTSILFGAGSTALVILVIVFGFYVSDSPHEVREMRIDQEQVNDLQNISWAVYEYYEIEEVLPESVFELYNGKALPEARDGRAPYAYNVIDDTTFEVCATFAKESRQDDFRPSYISIDGMRTMNDWSHGEGEICFTRTVK